MFYSKILLPCIKTLHLFWGLSLPPFTSGEELQPPCPTAPPHLMGNIGVDCCAYMIAVQGHTFCLGRQ